jgi:TonB family protein
MSPFFIYLFEVSVCLGAFYLLYITAFAGQRYFQLNRWYLNLGLVLSFIIPATEFSTPVTGIPGFYTALLEQITVTQGATEPAASTLDFNTVIWVVYLSGVLLLSIRLLIQLTGVVKLIRSADAITAESGYSLVNIADEEIVGSFFRYILWGHQSNLNSSEARLIIDHEAVHARQGHSFDVMMFELTGIILWFNPFIHLLKNAVNVNHEYIADQVVAQFGRQQYIRLIAARALSSQGIGLTSSFNSSQIINRLKMLKTNTTRSTITRYLLVTPVLLLLIAVFSCETGMELQEEQPSSTVEGEIFTKVDQGPEFPGGITTFYDYVGDNLKYPEEARKKGIEGKVFIEFVVDKSGRVNDTKILRGISPDCDAEALRVIANSPKWLPASHNDHVVNVRMVMPIMFKLD